MFHKRRQSRKSGLNCTDKYGCLDSGEMGENMRNNEDDGSSDDNESDEEEDGWRSIWFWCFEWLGFVKGHCQSQVTKRFTKIKSRMPVALWSTTTGLLLRNE